MVIKGAVIVAKAIALGDRPYIYGGGQKLQAFWELHLPCYLIVMFCYNQGWDGCKECYKNIVEWVKKCVKIIFFVLVTVVMAVEVTKAKFLCRCYGMFHADSRNGRA